MLLGRLACQPAHRPRPPTLSSYLGLLMLTMGPALAATAFAQATSTVHQLSRLSLAELGNVQITSVSKSAQPLESAAASIYVITREDLQRSGILTVAEALRLAPNLQVIRLTPTSYQVSARGFGGNQGAQNFSNKLLILIDGRSVYSPLFSGIYFDAQDVVLDDVERIEVVSGPGATLWGANAMNGVINIITRSAAATRGTLAHAAGGNLEQALEARFGSGASDALAWRIYSKGYRHEALELESGAGAQDSWNRVQGGFRVDWSSGSDVVTASGDIYRATQNLAASDADGVISGHNVLARWERSGHSSTWQLQAYADSTERESPAGGAFTLDTWDIELQHSVDFGAHRLVWGAGKRVSRYRIVNTDSLLFLPSRRTLGLANVFAEGTLSLSGSVKLMAGLKMEDDPYVGWSALPDLRVSWAPYRDALLWAGVSRAIRSPTPFDVDVQEKLGGQVFLVGNPDFRPEEVTAWQLGYRVRPNAKLSLTAAAFYNRYDDLRTIEVDPDSGFLPLRWDNHMRGNTYGVEAWADIQVTPRWRVSPGLRTLEKDLELDDGASGILGLGQAGNDPQWQASLKSSLDFASRGTFDLHLRHVDELPDPITPDYYELSARLGWRLSDSLEIAVSGFNLLDRRHVEYVPEGEYIGRSFVAELRWSE